MTDSRREPVRPHPALARGPGGELRSELYRDVFKSRAGAAAEARTVFVDGCRVVERWRSRDRFAILELGFGAGINFVETWRCWRAAQAPPRRLEYVAVELHPLRAEDLHAALEHAGVDAELRSELLRQWPLPVAGLHRIELEHGAVRLTLALGDAQRMVPELAGSFDAFYLDGFAPDRNPQMWTRPLLAALGRLARDDARIATYSVAAPVREALAEAGFDVERLPGFGDKRHRLAGRFAPRWATRRPVGTVREAHRGERHALVVGAGLAGVSVAAALGTRGWRVDLLDAAGAPAAGGSSQPSCADHLHVSPDDNVLARLCRSGLLGARAYRWNGATQAAPIGRLVVAGDPQELEHMRELVDRAALPPQLLAFADIDRAREECGIAVARGGLMMPLAGAADPASCIHRWLTAAGEGCTWHSDTRIVSIRREADGWCLLDDGGSEHRAPVVVLANAADASRVASMTLPALRRIGGQTTLLQARGLAGLVRCLGGTAYACPVGDGRVLVGSTFEPEGESLDIDEADRSNLARLQRMLVPGALDAHPRIVGAFRGERAVSPDRLPLVGALPDEAAILDARDAHHRNDRLPLARRPGLYGAFAFGARGMLLAPLAAEVLAAELDGEVSPIERSLLDAIDPARFVRRRLRYTTRLPSRPTPT